MTDPNPSHPPLDNPNNNDVYLDPEAEAAAMALAMGFSSFGQQAPLAGGDSDPDDNNTNNNSDRPPKKRRYNSRVDAYVGPAPRGTGANDVPVQRRVFNNAPKEERLGAEMGDGLRDGLKDGNEINLDDNEINLDEGDNEVVVAGSSAMTTTTMLPINPSLPPVPGLPPKPQVATQQGFNNPSNSHNHSQRGGLGSRGSRGGRDGRGGHNHGAGNTHGRDPTKPWYTEYYDPSSNENPWERLEQARGMEAVGKWLPSRSGAGSGGGGRGGRGGFGSGSGSGPGASLQHGVQVQEVSQGVPQEVSQQEA